MIKCCLGCEEDKEQFPGNCHVYCETYLSEVEENKRVREKIQEARHKESLLESRYTLKNGRRRIDRERWR